MTKIELKQSANFLFPLNLLHNVEVHKSDLSSACSLIWRSALSQTLSLMSATTILLIMLIVSCIHLQFQLFLAMVRNYSLKDTYECVGCTDPSADSHLS